MFITLNIATVVVLHLIGLSMVLAIRYDAAWLVLGLLSTVIGSLYMGGFALLLSAWFISLLVSALGHYRDYIHNRKYEYGETTQQEYQG